MSLRTVVLGILLGWGLWVPPSPFAQSAPTSVVRGRVLDAETNAPLPHTHVFNARSMIGTVTDSTGRFRLEGVPPGTKRLYVSHVGYEKKSIRVRAVPGRPQIVTARLASKVIQSPPVTVSARRGEEWHERLDRFKQLFIGPSTLADQCTLRNPEVLRFEEKWWGKFEVRAQKPIVIENRALGYRVRYFLKAFEKQGSLVRWDGEPLFEPLTPKDSTQAVRWRQRRREAYRGSPRHFLRALIEDRLAAEQFALYRLPRASAFRYPNRADRIPARRDDILASGPDSTYRLDAHDRLEVIYRGESESDAYLDWANLRRAPRDHQTSQIDINDPPIHVDPSGEIVEPYGATFYQYFAYTARIAKLLPREYEPPKQPP
ncbi:MAG: carboxypeptidase-like regulatory domain-containing protein [Salinibacter sp.]